MSMRIFFAPNKHLPRLLINSTEQSVEIVSSKFLYQIQAYDPDLLLNDQMHLVPPAIEYDIYPKTHLDIERYTGRIFLKNVQERKINFTLTMTDFGQPDRLQARQQLVFDIKPNDTISIPMALLGATVLLLVILLSLLVLLVLSCCCCCSPATRQKPPKPQQTSWTNISPTTADTRLIDHEYVSPVSHSKSSFDSFVESVRRWPRVQQPCLGCLVENSVSIRHLPTCTSTRNPSRNDDLSLIRLWIGTRQWRKSLFIAMVSNVSP